MEKKGWAKGQEQEEAQKEEDKAEKTPNETLTSRHHHNSKGFSNIS